MPNYLKRFRQERWRKVLHIGILTFLAFAFLNFDTQAIKISLGIFTLIFVLVDFYRLKQGSWINKLLEKWFGPVVRKWEHKRISSSSFTLIGNYITFLFFPAEIAALGALYSGWGDPASMIGRLFSNGSRLFKYRTVEGFMGFWLAAIIATIILSGLYPNLFVNVAIWPVAIIGGFIGAITEAISTKWDDNFTVPVVSSLALWILFLIF